MYAAKIDFLFESALFLAAVSFSLCVYVLSKGVGNKLNLAYSALTLCISVWAFSFFVANVLEWRLAESTHILATLMLAPMSLLFLNVFLRPDGDVFPWVMRVALGSCILLFFPIVFGLDRTPWIRDLAFYSPSLIVVANLYLFLSETLGKVRPRGGWGEFSILSSIEMKHALRRRNFWLYLGGALVTILCVMDRVSWMGRTLPAIGNLLLALYFYFIKDAVVNPSMVSSRRIIGNLLANSVAAFVTFLSFFLMTRWVIGNFTLYYINAFFAAFVATLTMDPVRSLVRILYQNFFLKEAKRINEITQEAGKEISGAFHPMAIAAATEKFLGSALDAAMISFYAVDADGKNYRKIRDRSAKEELPEALPASFPLVQHFLRAKKWTPALAVELERSASRETQPSKQAIFRLSKEALDSLESTLALPLVHNKSVVGFATVSLKGPPSHWEESWGALPLLEPYFRRAGEAMAELDIYARLRERDRLATLGEMAAGLAHEIRNPLGAIKGAAQLLEGQDQNNQFLKIIVEEVNRLNAVVTQFLNYAKPFQGQAEFCDLVNLTKEASKNFAEKCQQEGVDFSLLLPDSMPPVKCQPNLIRLVIANLLENSFCAVKAEKKPKSNSQIILRLAHSVRESLVEVSLSVEDNGPGIDAEAMDKIFIPFFTQSPQGTGLGLSICQKIAEAHGGRMEASSIVGEGTWMTLRFQAERKE
jgi:two-component system sensor histidine kinase HydH